MIRSLLSLLWLIASTQAQFSCTLSHTDESSCLDAKDDSGADHCVWCSVAGFGVCVSETQAEQMEDTLPNAQCDRYSGSDDDATPSDDDDKTPSDDDHVSPPSDDSLPDDFWQCLQKKDAKSCSSADCTWCVSKQYHFGLCMTGPTADSAADSDFFDCTKEDDAMDVDYDYNDDEQGDDIDDIELVQDPADTACLSAFLQDPTKEGCTSAVDSDGQPCQWCDWKGVTHLCLTEEQAEDSTSQSDLGITCGGDGDSEEATTTAEAAAVAHLRGVLKRDSDNNKDGKKDDKEQDPYDPSCLLAYLQDPSEETCEAATDSDGLPCLYCDLQGQAQLCLNQDQAAYGEQIGMTCNSDVEDEDKEESVVAAAPESNPYDPSCALAFLADMTPDTCLQAVDEDGQPCEYCTLQGSLNLCLTQEQAQVGESLGIECQGQDDDEEPPQNVESDPLDTSCLMAQLKADGHMEPSDCTAATDNDGEPCEFCSIPGVTDALCLTNTQADIAQQAGDFVQCGAATALKDPKDPTCALEYLQNPTEEGCTSAADQDGNACKYCTFQGQINLCLNEEQAEMAEQFGIDCDGDAGDEDLQENVQDVLDTSCLMAFVDAGGQMTPDDCVSTLDAAGNACEFCSIPGVTNSLCLTSEQAELATQFGGDHVQCGETAAEAGLEFPPNMFKCLQEYQEHDCNSSGDGCTWCNSEVGMGFCVADAAADALSECDFFSCDDRKKVATVTLEKVEKLNANMPFDPKCLAAGMGSDDAEDVCNGTLDSEGNACVWCDAAGVYGLCLSAESAEMAQEYLQCDNNSNDNNLVATE